MIRTRKMRFLFTVIVMLLIAVVYYFVIAPETLTEFEVQLTETYTVMATRASEDWDIWLTACESVKATATQDASQYYIKP